MKNQELKVLFYLKKTAYNQSGLSPIMGRITIGHTIAQFSAKLKCSPDLWDGHKGRLKGKSAEALRINRAIEKDIGRQGFGNPEKIRSVIQASFNIHPGKIPLYGHFFCAGV